VIMSNIVEELRRLEKSEPDYISATLKEASETIVHLCTLIVVLNKALIIGTQMREVQRKYFHTRDHGYLVESKVLEKRFDDQAQEALTMQETLDTMGESNDRQSE